MFFLLIFKTFFLDLFFNFLYSFLALAIVPSPSSVFSFFLYLCYFSSNCVTTFFSAHVSDKASKERDYARSESDGLARLCAEYKKY